MIERCNPLSPLGQGAHEFKSSFSHEKTKYVILEEEESHDRTGQPVVCPQRGAMPQQFITGDDETELELSLGSRSFLDRVNDQVRKRQKRSSMNVTENDEKHYVIWGMFMSVTLESALFMGKNYPDNQHSIKNTKDLTMKQKFDISAKLVSEQVSAQRSTSFQILYCVLVRYTRSPNQTMHGNKDWSGSKHLRNTENLTELMVSQWNSSGIFSQDSILSAQ